MTTLSFFKQSSLYTIGNIANRLAGFLMIPLYTHYLSPEVYGVLDLIELFLMMAIIVFGLQSIGGAMTRIYYDFEDIDKRQRVISTALIGLAALNLAVVLVGVLSAAALSNLVFGSTQYKDLISVAFVAMFFGNMVEAVLVYERICQRALFFVGYSLIALVASLALNIYFIAFLHLGIWGFIWGKLIVTTAGASYLVARTLPKVGMAFDRSIGMRMVKFGSPLIVVGLAFFAIHFSNRFFLNSYASLHDVGIYSLAYKFAILITIVVGEPFGRVWSVNVYDYCKQDGWKARFARILAYFMFFLVLCGLGISLFIEDVIRLMADDSFLPAAALVPLLIVGYVLRECGDFFRNILYINKRSGLMSRIAGSCALLTLALNWALIPAFGLYGAAVATAATWLVYLLLCWRAQHLEFGIAFPIKQFAWLASAAFVVYMVSIEVTVETWYFRLLFNSGLISIFLLLIWFSNYLDVDEKKQVKSALTKALRFLLRKSSSHSS